MSKKSFVGLDIGGSGIRAAEVKGKPGAHRSCAQHPWISPGVIVDGQIVDQSALVSALKKLWKSEQVLKQESRLRCDRQRRHDPADGTSLDGRKGLQRVVALPGR